LGQFKLLLLEDMIVPWEKKGLSCCLVQLKLFLEDMIVPQGKKRLKLFLAFFPPRNNNILGEKKLKLL
jgi:hypothetical protein